MKETIKTSTGVLQKITLTQKQLCDLELILDGSFKPLKGFLTQKDYSSVIDKMRLSDGSLWPIPITLDLSEETIRLIENEKTLELRDQEGFLIALMNIEDIWKPDKKEEALKVFGTTNAEHPGVSQLYNTNEYYAGGALKKIGSVTHHDFKDLRLSPSEVINKIKALSNKKTI